jgi:hypothetical protein
MAASFNNAISLRALPVVEGQQRFWIRAAQLRTPKMTPDARFVVIPGHMNDRNQVFYDIERASFYLNPKEFAQLVGARPVDADRLTAGFTQFVEKRTRGSAEPWFSIPVDNEAIPLVIRKKVPSLIDAAKTGLRLGWGNMYQAEINGDNHSAAFRFFPQEFQAEAMRIGNYFIADCQSDQTGTFQWKNYRMSERKSIRLEGQKFMERWTHSDAVAARY